MKSPKSILSRQLSAPLLALCLLGLALFLSGYTLKHQKKSVDHDFVPPPYMALVRQALVNKELAVAVRFLKAARKCWEKRGRVCGFPKHSYLIYLGVLTLQRNQVPRAVSLLQQAKRLWKRSAPVKPKTPTKLSKEARKQHRRLGDTLSFYLGQAYFRAKKYQEAAAELHGIEKMASKMPGFYRLLALSQLEAKDYDSARRTLQRAMVAFPKEPGFLHIAAILYLRVGAWQAALDLGRRLLRAVPKSDATSFLRTIDAMRQAGLIYQVLPLLEEARLYLPKHEGIIMRLGIAYSQAQMPGAAALCFSKLAATQPKMAYYAAAAWMQAGQLHKALRWNQRVPDLRQQTQQRSRILLGQGQFAWALALLQRQWRKEALGPHERYRLAYVAIRLGQYALAQKVLASLKGTSHAGLAQKLTKTMRLCQATPWRCID